MLQSKSSSDDNTALTHYATISVMGKVLWHVDEHGYLYTPAGQRVARIDRDGHLWFWDKKNRREICLTRCHLDIITEVIRDGQSNSLLRA